MRRYPSENTLRLQAEAERLTGGRCEWFLSVTDDGDAALRLYIDSTSYENVVELFESDSADVDSAKRRLLALALRETKAATS